MKRIIYSLYIDVPENEFVDNIETNLNTKKQFKENYIKLLANKQWYSDLIGVEFKMFEYDEKFKEYQNYFNKKYPFITTYNIVNFYKLHLLCELSKSYDEILYLDFDVVCLTNENFFETWNLNKGICVYNNSSLVKTIEAVTERSQTIRSPTSKYYNTQAMLIEKGLNPKNKVINTGIIGANKEHLKQLKYFDNFDEDINTMTKIKSNYDMFPKKIVDFFGYDNETLFSVKLNEHKVPVQWLDNQWHYFFDTQGFIPKETKFVHTINKKFDVVWRRYYA
jgi:hypothetical protein